MQEKYLDIGKSLEHNPQRFTKWMFLARGGPCSPEALKRRKGTVPLMKLSTLREIINSVHLSRYVESTFPQRGGLMLVAPPAALKTSILEFLTEYPSAMILSDINVQTLSRLRADISSGHLSTLAFTELEKIYQRHGSVASNVEGHLKAFVDEGFRHASFEDQRTPIHPARCTIIACMTPVFFNKKISDWFDDGFARRFIWCHYHLENPELITEAIGKWELLELDGEFVFKTPANRKIPYNLTPKESELLKRMLRFHKNRETPFILLSKMACALKWRFGDKEPDKWIHILKDFEPALGKEGATVTI
jgi:hypothetical protein